MALNLASSDTFTAVFNEGFLDTGGSLFTTVYHRNFGIFIQRGDQNF